MNLTVDDRARFLSILPDHYEKVGVIFTLPEAMMYTRLHDRTFRTGRPFTKPIVQNLIRRLEKPQWGEFDRETPIDHRCVYV